MNDGQYKEAMERLRSNPIFQQYEKAVSQLHSTDLPEDYKKLFCPDPDLVKKILPYLSEGGIETFGPLFQQYTDKVKKAFDCLNHGDHDDHDSHD